MQEENRPPLALPGISETEHGAKEIKVNAEQPTSLYDQLGPLVINTDGTASRISNWAHLMEHERKNILRVLGKRNAARIESLAPKQE